MGRIHVIVGEDEYLVSETAKKIVGDGVGLEVVDSLNSSNEELRLRDLAAVDASFSTPPFLEPKKTTWWKNVRFLPGNSRKKDETASEAVKDALEKFAKKLAKAPLPENQQFVLTAPKLLMTSVFAKTLKGVAEFAVFASGKPWEMQKTALARVLEFAGGMNLKFEAGAAERFVARVGTDSRSLVSELGKLRDYLGPKCHTVAAADVEAVTSQGVGVEPELWAVTDALGARKPEDVAAAVRPFEGENGFGVLMTTVVEKFFRQLAELKDAQEQGKFAEATEGMAPFVLRKNQGFLRNWTLRELRIARFRFLKLREKVVATSGSADALVLVELLRACRRR